MATALTFACVAAAAAVVVPSLIGPQAAAESPSPPVAIARQRVRELEEQLISVQAAAGQSADAYAGANAKVAQLENAIRLNTAELAVAKTEIAASRAALIDRILSLYVDPPPSMIEVLVSSGSITSAMDSFDLMRHIADEDQNLVVRFVADKDRLDALNTSLTQDASLAVANRAAVAQRLGQLRALAGQRSALLASATTVLSESEASARQIAALRAEEARAAAAAAANATPHQIIAATPPSGSGSSGSETASTAPTQGSGAPSGGLTAILWKIAMCESGGNPHAISPNGEYRGLFQFTYATWASVGGSGDPAQASVAEQFALAAILYQRAGPGQWPVCGA